MNSLGEVYETIACTHLQAAGLSLLTRNFSTRFGELDLVMRDRDVLVFVEVRYRARSRFGNGAESITAAKRARLTTAAEQYRQAVLRDNNARRDGRYRLFARADLDGPEAQALYGTLRGRRPWLDPTLAVFERRADRPPAGAQPDMVEVYAAGFAKMQQLTRRAALAGARVVLGGHTEVPFAGRGEAPWRELELLVESGFTPLEALTAATSTAAAFLYQSDSLGSLRPSFKADLVVFRGDPTTRIADVRTVERAMLGGTWVDVERYRTY